MAEQKRASRAGKAGTLRERKIGAAVSDLMKKLREIDPKRVFELRTSSNLVKAGHFSDWHDRFSDGGGFADGFGKAGSPIAAFRQARSARAEGEKASS